MKCAVRSAAASCGMLLVAIAVALPAHAYEALEGRIQAHGFFESTARVMNANYAEDWDTTQWVQVFNLELEIELVQDTHWILDLLEAYARVEVRYDCIYSRGCGMFKNMNVYGDRAKSLPRRLSNAHGTSAAGGILISDDTGRLSGGSTDTVPLDETEGFATLAGQSGADTLVGDPDVGTACRTNTGYLDFVNSAANASGVTIGDLCSTLAGGRISPIDNNDDPFPAALAAWIDFQFTQVNVRGGNNSGNPVQVLGPWLPKNFIEMQAALSDFQNPFDDQAQSITLRAAVFNDAFTNPNSQVETSPGVFENTASWEGLSLQKADESRGSGALPFRPVPIYKAGRRGEGDGKARGLYIPSAGLLKARAKGNTKELPLNFRESERAWNYGSSQQDEKELKEAYLEAEMFDSRLWLRLGKQTVVWGKTELFRSTDQWNPQDLALSSLPSLEESRIGLWAARGVWSFYNVGPFEDVRIEGVFLYDQYESADLGACGEPYTINLVCGGSFGGFAHGVTGIGVAGADFPESPWESREGWEVGARLEWRWDRFSFAVSDYWGFSDLPYIEYISNYERNVDPFTGRPRIQDARGPCAEGYTGNEADCLTAGPQTTKNSPDYATKVHLSDGLTDKQRLKDPRNGLVNHPGNQQIFAFICSTTVGAVGLDRTACAQNAFGSQVVPLIGFTISQFVGALIAGSPTANDAFEANPAGGFRLPLTRLHAADGGPLSGGDTYDLANTNDCFDDIYSSTPLGGGGAPPTCGSGGAGAFATTVGEALGQHLTPWQEALLGCGPFWGTNCDDSGIDLLNTDASALYQSFTGFEGTVEGWKTTDASVAQPGTVGFSGLSTVCTVGALMSDAEIAANGGLDKVSKLRLPGCRGIDPQGRRKPNGKFRMQKGYVKTIDGDPRAMAALPGGAGLHPFTGQVWQNELAGVSWNFMLLSISQDVDFDPDKSMSKKRCSFVRPQLCENVQGLLRLGGVERPDVRAGGSADGRFGRRTFQWHGGAEVIVKFDRRNVLGGAMDFAEDYTKSNWSFELTWIDDVKVFNTDERDLISEADEYNLSMSVDRPTFINFLNANRTFFFNSQWFVQYRDNWTRGNGGHAWNVLATLAATTGYYQDRLLPTMVFVWDFQSVSGAALPQITYRFNEAFSVTFGAALFMGRFEQSEMPLNPIGGGSGRIWSQDNAYKDAGPTGLAAIRDRDELFLKIRYTF